MTEISYWHAFFYFLAIGSLAAIWLGSRRVVAFPARTRPQPTANPDDPEDLAKQPAHEQYRQDVGRESDKVEFRVWAPHTVDTNELFAIRVEVDNLALVTNRDTRQARASDYESIETEVLQGARISLVLQSAPVPQSDYTDVRCAISAPFQVLEWLSQRVVVTFHVRSPDFSTQHPFPFDLVIMIDGASIGKLELEVKVKRHWLSANSHTLSAKPLQIEDTSIRDRREFARVRARPAQRAFICYRHDNWEAVSKYCQPLEISGIRCLIDNLELRPTSKWQAEVVKLIATADLALIFWTKEMPTSPSCTDEMRFLCDEIDRVEKGGRKRPFWIGIVNLDNSVVQLPEKIRQASLQSKRFETYDAYYRMQQPSAADEDEKQFRARCHVVEH